ncbi:hypothetical protein AB4201_18985, partial [Vibrio lentus]
MIFFKRNKAILFYLTSDAISKLVPFLILPLLSKELDVKLFADFTLNLVLINVFSMAVLSGVISKIVIDHSNKIDVRINING